MHFWWVCLSLHWTSVSNWFYLVWTGSPNVLPPPQLLSPHLNSRSLNKQLKSQENIYVMTAIIFLQTWIFQGLLCLMCGSKVPLKLLMFHNVVQFVSDHSLCNTRVPCLIFRYLIRLPRWPREKTCPPSSWCWLEMEALVGCETPRATWTSD